MIIVRVCVLLPLLFSSLHNPHTERIIESGVSYGEQYSVQHSVQYSVNAFNENIVCLHLPHGIRIPSAAMPGKYLNGSEWICRHPLRINSEHCLIVFSRVSFVLRWSAAFHKLFISSIVWNPYFEIHRLHKFVVLPGMPLSVERTMCLF